MVRVVRDRECDERDEVLGRCRRELVGDEDGVLSGYTVLGQLCDLWIVAEISCCRLSSMSPCGMALPVSEDKVDGCPAVDRF